MVQKVNIKLEVPERKKNRKTKGGIKETTLENFWELKKNSFYFERAH